MIVMGNAFCLPSPATIQELFSVARDGGVVPDISLDGTLTSFLSLDSTSALQHQYSALQQSLSAHQLANFTQGVTSALGGSTRVSHGGVGVVALALSLLFDILAHQVRSQGGGDAALDHTQRVSGVSNSSRIGAIIGGYLWRVPGVANDPERIAEVTELYDQWLEYELIDHYERMTDKKRMGTEAMRQWLAGAAFHLHLRIHQIRLGSVPRGSAESLRLSYRTAFSRLVQGYTAYLRRNIQETPPARGPSRGPGARSALGPRGVLSISEAALGPSGVTDISEAALGPSGVTGIPEAALGPSGVTGIPEAALGPSSVPGISEAALGPSGVPDISEVALGPSSVPGIAALGPSGVTDISEAALGPSGVTDISEAALGLSGVAGIPEAALGPSGVTDISEAALGPSGVPGISEAALGPSGVAEIPEAALGPSGVLGMSGSALGPSDDTSQDSRPTDPVGLGPSGRNRESTPGPSTVASPAIEPRGFLEREGPVLGPSAMSARSGPGLLVVESLKNVSHQVKHHPCESPAIIDALVTRIMAAQNLQDSRNFFIHGEKYFDRLLSQRAAFELRKSPVRKRS